MPKVELIGLRSIDEYKMLLTGRLIPNDFQMRNLKLLIGIDLSINCTFSLQDNIDGFMKMKNYNSPFDGARPLDFALDKSLEEASNAINAMLRI